MSLLRRCRSPGKLMVWIFILFFLLHLTTIVQPWSEKGNESFRQPNESDIIHTTNQSYAGSQEVRDFVGSMATQYPAPFARVTRADGLRHGNLTLSKPDGSAVVIVVNSCEKGNSFEIENTLNTCFAAQPGGGVKAVVLHDARNGGGAADVYLVCGVSLPGGNTWHDRFVNADVCPENADGMHRLAQVSGISATRPSQRIMDGIRGLWGPNSLGDKSQLCKLSSMLRKRFGIGVAPPCFTVPDQKPAAAELADLAAKHPFWIYKPAMTTSGNGIRFVTGKEMLAGGFEDGSLVAYIHNPFLLERGSPPNNVKIKIDLRIYGVQTSVQPMRLYVSKHFYFRTAHPDVNFTMDAGFQDSRLMHVTNNDPKLKKGLWVTHPLEFDDRKERTPYSPVMEDKFASAGTHHKFWKLVEERGLRTDVVWGNLLALFARLHAGGQQWMLPGCKSALLGSENICSQEFTTFFADVGIDAHGEVILYETHPSCNLKRCSTKYLIAKFPYSKGCENVPVVTEYSDRPGTWGTMAMGFARYIEPDFMIFAQRWIDDKVAEVATEVRRCQSPTQTFVADGCLTTQAEGVLVQMAHEDHLACRLGVQDAFFVLKGRSHAPHVELDVGGLRVQLSAMLDTGSLRFYAMYEGLRLGDVAEAFNGHACRGEEDEVYFGHAFENGCRR